MKITAKQKDAIPKILAQPTLKQGFKAAGISKPTYYAWMKQEAFATEIERQRGALAVECFDTIAQNLTKAAEAIASLVESDHETTQRLAALNLIELHLKHRELKDLGDRLLSLETKIQELKNEH